MAHASRLGQFSKHASRLGQLRVNDLQQLFEAASPKTIFGTANLEAAAGIKDEPQHQQRKRKARNGQLTGNLDSNRNFL